MNDRLYHLLESIKNRFEVSESVAWKGFRRHRQGILF